MHIVWNEDSATPRPLRLCVKTKLFDFYFHARRAISLAKPAVRVVAVAVRFSRPSIAVSENVPL